MSNRSFTVSILLILCACFAQDIRAIEYDFDDVFRFTTMPVTSETVAITGFTYIREPLPEETPIQADQIVSMTIPPEVTVIKTAALSGFTGLKSLSIADASSELTIDAGGIYCPNLTTLYLGRNMASNSDKFANLLQLESLQLGSKVTKIEDESFCYDAKLTNVKFPDGLVSIGDNAFGGCTSLTDVTFPPSLETLERNAFQSCTSLKNLSLRSALSVIPDDAFSGCTSLTSLTIPENIDSIGWRSFLECPNIRELIIEDSAKELVLEALSLKSYVYYTVFGSQPIESLYIGRNLTVNQDVQAGASRYPDWVFPERPIKTVTIGDCVTELSYTFAGCEVLEEVLMGKNVSRLGPVTFDDCISLKSISLPGVKEIGTECFRGCHGLSEINFGDELEMIGENALMECKSLKELRLPKSLREIKRFAFWVIDTYSDNPYNVALKDIYCEWDKPVESDVAFGIYLDVWPDTLYRTATLHIPAGTLEAYKAVQPWCNFINIIEDVNSAIDAVSADDEQTVISVENGIITLSDPQGNPVKVTVYDLAGKCVYQGTTTSITHLGHGAYIIRAGRQVKKIII